MPFSTMLCAAPRGSPRAGPGHALRPGHPAAQSGVGSRAGQEITSPEDVLGYMMPLAGAAPERTHLVQYATRWEGRPLHALAVGSREGMAVWTRRRPTCASSPPANAVDSYSRVTCAEAWRAACRLLANTCC